MVPECVDLPHLSNAVRPRDFLACGSSFLPFLFVLPSVLSSLRSEERGRFRVVPCTLSASVTCVVSRYKGDNAYLYREQRKASRRRVE